MRDSWSAPAPSARSALLSASVNACECWWTHLTATTAVARSEGDAPDIDGVVRISKAGKLAVGEFADVKVVGADAYDLFAKASRPDAAARRSVQTERLARSCRE